MRAFYFAVVLSLIFVSCDKDKSTFLWVSEARYNVTITSKWASPAFTVPLPAHFTTFVGMVHNGNTSMWKEGATASAGMEMLAELGNGVALLTEIESKITAGTASSLLLFLAPELTGSRSTSLYCNTNYSHVSFASMLGPTPDWFVGVSGIDLYANQQWVSDTTINLYAMDAGTEDGDAFSTVNPATLPQQNIQVLTAAKATVLANGNPSLVPIATARFTRK